MDREGVGSIRGRELQSTFQASILTSIFLDRFMWSDIPRLPFIIINF